MFLLCYLHTEVSPDGPRTAVGSVCLYQEFPAGVHHSLPLPDHGQDRAASHVPDQAREERFPGQVGVVLLQQGNTSQLELETNQIQTFLLESKIFGCPSAL